MFEDPVDRGDSGDLWRIRIWDLILLPFIVLGDMDRFETLSLWPLRERDYASVSMRPVRIAYLMNSARLDRPSLPIMLARCFSTVLTLR